MWRQSNELRQIILKHEWSQKFVKNYIVTYLQEELALSCIDNQRFACSFAKKPVIFEKV